MTKVASPTIKFSSDELMELRRAIHAVWDDIGWDILKAVADNKGKDVEAITISRAVVIEVCLDADRPEEKLRDQLRRIHADGKPNTVTEDLLLRWEGTSYKQRQKIARSTFGYTRYGL
jgi:hypothetical protein